MEIWFRMPQAARIALSAAVGFSVAFLAFLVGDLDHLSRGYNGSRIEGWLILATVAGLLLVPAALGADATLHRDFRSMSQFIEYRRALRTGELPAVIDPDVWRGWLGRTVGLKRMAQLLAWLLVVVVVLPSLTSQSLYRWVTASVYALLAIWILFASRRTGARIVRLAAEVDRHQYVPAPAAAPSEEQGPGAWFGRPPPVHLFVPAVAGFFAAFSAFLASDPVALYNGSPEHLAWAATWATLVSAAVAASSWWSQRHVTRDFPSIEQFTTYGRAVRSGELPAQIEPDVWRTWLGHTHRSHRLAPLWSLLVVTFGVAPGLIHQPAHYWVTAALFGLLAIWNLLWSRSQRTRLTQLAAEVERRTTRSPTA